MKQKIETLLAQLNHGLVEREEHLKMALLTILAGENLVLIGPPGTGKSLVARRVAQCVEHPGDAAAYFEYLLTKFSTPEEIFGPLSITELKADRFRRNTAGYLPSVKIAFVDEIFKASSSILNALLTILNERIYHNGAEAQQIPLQALIAASNELPTGQEELAALYDRFLVRCFVNYVRAENLTRLFEKDTSPPSLEKLSAVDLDAIKESANNVVLPPHIIDAIQSIWQKHKDVFREDQRECLSDRRLKKLIKLLYFSAATNGRREVDLSDVMLLKNCLWNHPDNMEKVHELILSALRENSTTAVVASPQSDDEEVYELAEDGRTLVQTRRSGSVSLTNGAGSRAVVSRAAGRIVIKGYTGSGTKHDPLLISTLEELMDLRRPEIGQQGHHFRQAADIDCSVINAWPAIDFNGNYDGGGFSISRDEDSGNLFSFGVSLCLFSNVASGSIIENVVFDNLFMASCVSDSEIHFCASSVGLVEKDICRSTVVGCTISGALAERCDGCDIYRCQSSSALIKIEASNCRIENCLVSTTIDSDSSVGVYIAYRLAKRSSVHSCFCTTNGEEGYGGVGQISHECKSSTISCCAVGENLKTHWGRRISLPNKSSRLENNASISGNKGTSDANGPDGESVDPSLFNQRYFELTLGWDFENTWYWDDEANEPRLRNVGAGHSAPVVSSVAVSEAEAVDLLTRQVQANVWL